MIRVDARAELPPVALGSPGVARGAAAAPPSRLVYVDRLRLLVVVGVFVVHVAEVFNPWDEWHVSNALRSRVVGEAAVLLAPWIMPLMMLLAGVSASFSLERRENGVYVRERAQRVLLPLVIGTLTLVPPQVWLERRLRGQFHGSLWDFYPHFFDGVYPRGNLSWHHLWFLAHLFLYSLAALPLFRWWQSDGGRRQVRWLARLASGPGGLLWLAVPLVVERHLLWAAFPERHMLTSDWSNHALLFVAYLYGFVLAGEEWLGRRVDAEWPWALVTAVVCMSALVAATWYGLVPRRLPAPYSLAYLAFWTVYAVCSWACMVSALGLARRHARRPRPPSRVVAYGGDVGLLWYLVHQPVIIAVAYVVIPWRAALALKVLALAAGSAVATLAAADALHRLPEIGRAAARALRQR